MKLSAITVQGAADLRVRKYLAEDLAPFGVAWIATLAPDSSGRLVVDAEDGGSPVALDVGRGPSFTDAADRALRSFADVDTTARQILTLRDGLSGTRLTSSLVLPRVPTRSETEAQRLALAALFGASGPWTGFAGPTFPTVAQVILAERPCVVTVHLQRDLKHWRLVSVADDVVLCLGAAMLSRDPDAGACVGARAPQPPSDPRRIGRRWLRKSRRRRAA